MMQKSIITLFTIGLAACVCKAGSFSANEFWRSQPQSFNWGGMTWISSGLTDGDSSHIYTATDRLPGLDVAEITFGEAGGYEDEMGTRFFQIYGYDATAGISASASAMGWPGYSADVSGSFYAFGAMNSNDETVPMPQWFGESSTLWTNMASSLTVPEVTAFPLAIPFLLALRRRPSQRAALQHSALRSEPVPVSA